MSIKSRQILEHLRVSLGFAAQALAGLPAIDVMMEHLRASAWKGIGEYVAFYYPLDALIALVASIILLGIGRFLLRYWQKELMIVVGTLYGMVLIQGVTIELAERSLKECGRAFC